MSILDKVLEGEEPEENKWNFLGIVEQPRYFIETPPPVIYRGPDGKEYANQNEYLNTLLGCKVKAQYKHADYWVDGTLAKTYKGEWYIQGSYKGTRIRKETVIAIEAD